MLAEKIENLTFIEPRKIYRSNLFKQPKSPNCIAFYDLSTILEIESDMTNITKVKPIHNHHLNDTSANVLNSDSNNKNNNDNMSNIITEANYNNLENQKLNNNFNETKPKLRLEFNFEKKIQKNNNLVTSSNNSNNSSRSIK